MALYRRGNSIVSEEEFGRSIAQYKERDRKLYIDAGCPVLDEYGKECPNAKFLCTAGMGLYILKTEEEYNREMAEYKNRMRVNGVDEFNKQKYLSFQTAEYTQGCKEPKISRGYPQELEYTGGFRPRVDDINMKE